ncbi:MAG: threonine/serine dehydratase [Rhodospirillaceae bacterium]|nr:threonine/serine dehydratase [Rhodospirillaceae bacterium]
MTSIGPAAPDYADIEAAAARLAGHAAMTPLLSSAALDARTGGRMLIKAETLQRTGSFKFRGAYNKLRRLVDEGMRPDAVVAYSSGNHAQGVAAAAALLGIKAAIVMPSDAPAIKIANTRGYGAEIITYDRYRESREELAARIADERRAVIVPPYDDPDIIAGQGTAGREIVAQARALGTEPDALITPCGGGGLMAGLSIAVSHDCPDCTIHAAEPAAFDDTGRSLLAGERLANANDARSICDALLAPTPGELTFSINRKLVTSGVSVSDDEVRAAMAFAFDTLKLVVEPGGAVALSAILNGRIPTRGRTVAIVLSGGNVDPASFSEAIASKSPTGQK